MVTQAELRNIATQLRQLTAGQRRLDGLQSSRPAARPSMIRSCPAAIAMPVALAAALYVAAAQADIYTWTDATGRGNISNLEPAKDAKISNVVRTSAPKTTPE